MTCAHVIRRNAGAGPGQLVRVAIDRSGDGRDSAIFGARVETRYWRETDAEDIALLRLEGAPPASCAAVSLAGMLDERRVYRSWGFPMAKATSGLAAEVTQLAPSSDAGFPALSARSEEVSYGFSGAPVWDDETDVVIGMIMSIVGADADAGRRQRTTLFLRPTEEIWRVCPALRGSVDNPYRGLEVFEEEHVDFYHGRSRAIAELLRRLVERDLVAVVGVSGSGKSSLVGAGLRKGLNETPVLGAWVSNP